MSSRVAVIAIVAAMSLAACGTAPPTTAPSAATPVPPPSSPFSAAPTLPSASPNAALPIDDVAYQAGRIFSVPIGDAGIDWAAPSPAPVMPNGQPALRVAFLPASCTTGDFAIVADAAPADAWETNLQDDGTQHGYQFGSWPAAQVPECANGQGRTYLDVGYHPLAPLGTVHLMASIANVDGAPTTVDVVPVFTSADATQPSLTSDGFASLQPIAGAEKSRGTKPQTFFATDFNRTTLPDGTVPTTWGYQVTGCGPVGKTTVTLTARIGDAAPVEVGECSDGSFLTSGMALPIPADGTRVAVLMAGATTKSQVRVSEFQWRGDRP